MSLMLKLVVHQHGDLQVGGAEAHAVDLAAAAREGKPGFEVEGQFVAKQDLIGHGDVERGPRVGADGRTSGRNRVARQVQSGADAQDVLFVVLRRNGICQQDGGHDKQYFFHNEWVWVCIRGKYRIIFFEKSPPRIFLQTMKKNIRKCFCFSRIAVGCQKLYPMFTVRQLLRISALSGWSA